MCEPCRGNRCEKRDDVDLPIAAGFFQNAANVRADGVLRHAPGRGDGLDRFSGGEITGDARLGRCEIEQRLHQLNRRGLAAG
jgi:hypothetical protein